MFPILERFFQRTERIKYFVRADVIHLILCMVIILLNVYLLTTYKLVPVEDTFLSFFIQKRPAIEVSQDIVIIDIDEESIQSIGRWPWPWHYHAEMVKLLSEWGAKSVILDFIFKEKTASFENEELEQALKASGNVYLPVLLEEAQEKKYWVHSLEMVLGNNELKKHETWTGSAPALEKYTRGLGHINIEPDADGVLRRVAPYRTNGKNSYTQLGLQVAQDFKGINLQDPLMQLIPHDFNGQVYLNWVGPWKKHFTHYTYADLIRSHQAIQQGRRVVLNPEIVKDKICIIGLSVKDLTNLMVTPFSADDPFFGVQATLINSMLTHQWIRPVDLKWNALCLALIGLVVSFVFMSCRNVTGFLVSFILVGAWILFSFVVFCRTGIWLYVFHPIVLIVCLIIYSTIYNHILSNRERDRLFNLATRDGLTGLFVIRYFRELLNKAVEEAVGRKQPLSVILTDIDNFKSVNDTYGHIAGDMVLREVAKIAEASLRVKRPFGKADIVARYGGEEFIFLLPDTKLSDAARKSAERVRRNIEKKIFEWEGQVIPITLSLGVAILREGENVPDQMVRRADEALYEAKRTGKNKVCME